MATSSQATPDITAYMDNWYKTLGVQAVFACGGGIYLCC